jgi:ubiquitin C-terminal hydrolase
MNNPSPKSIAVSNSSSGLNNKITTNGPSMFNTTTTVSKTNFNVWNKLIGLDNLGNTCFMNTSLQCLIHTEAFMKRLIDQKDILKSKKVTSAFYEIIDDINSNLNKSSVRPSTFKSVFGQAHSMYLGFSQQDSQEFLRKLLEDISKELNRLTIVPRYKELETKGKEKSLLNLEYDKIFKAREDSIVADTFYGQVVNIFTCRDCLHPTFSFEKFLDIPLLLDDESPTDLYKLLSEHFKEDGFKWDSPCENEKCKRKSYHTKISKICYLPEILIFSFQRYSYRSRRKNTARVSFKETIDLKDYIDKDCVGIINLT